MKRSNSEVVCLKPDVSLFRRAGFKLSVKSSAQQHPPMDSQKTPRPGVR
jgi:hypothetical protein